MCNQTAIGAVVEPSAVVVVAVASAYAAARAVVCSPNVAAIVFTIAIALLDVPVEVVVFQRYTAYRDVLIRGAWATFGDLIAGIGIGQPVAQRYRDGEGNALIVSRFAAGTVNPPGIAAIAVAEIVVNSPPAAVVTQAQ